MSVKPALRRLSTCEHVPCRSLRLGAGVCMDLAAPIPIRPGSLDEVLSGNGKYFVSILLALAGYKSPVKTLTIRDVMSQPAMVRSIQASAAGAGPGPAERGFVEAFCACLTSEGLLDIQAASRARRATEASGERLDHV